MASEAVSKGTLSVLGHDFATVFTVTGYCLTSSLLSIINKAAVESFPYPSALTGLQYLTSAAAVYGFGAAGMIAPVDAFSWQLVWQMAPVVFCFYVAVFSNVKVLQHANVETFIVLRSTTPIFVALADAIFRPHAQVLIMLGAAGYVVVDSEFSTDSYIWGAIYTVIICTEMVWVKDIVSKIKLSNWGLVFYNNALCLIVSAVASLASNEGDIWAWLFGLSTIRNRRVDLPHTAPQAAAAGGAAPAAPPAAEEGRRLLVELSGEVSQVVVGRVNATSSGSSALSNLTMVNSTAYLETIERAAAEQAMRDTEIVTSSAMWAFTIVAVSCIFGLGISFFGFSTRRLISATAFTVLGCTNKLLTLLVNSLVWSHHASLMGQACVLVSILGGVLYSEYAKDDAAEHAKKAKPPPAAPEAEDKEQGVPLATVAQAPGGDEEQGAGARAGGESHGAGGGGVAVTAAGGGGGRSSAGGGGLS